MADVRPLTDSGGRRSSEFAEALGEGQRRAREFVAAQQGLLDSLEGNLLEQLELVGEQLAQQAESERLPRDEQSRDSEQTALEAAALAALADDLSRRETQIEAERVRLGAEQDLVKIAQAELEVQRKLSISELAQAEATLADSRQALEAEQVRVASERQALEAERIRRAADRELAERLALEQQDIELARQAVQQERTKLFVEREQLAADRCAVQLDRDEALAAQAQASRARECVEAEQRRLDAALDQLASDQAAARIAADDVDGVRQQTARAQERVEEDRKQLAALRTKLVGERVAIQTSQEEAAAWRAEFSRVREGLEAERQQLAQERQRLSDSEAETKNQRRRIAREFQVQRATHIAELERRRSELQAMGEASQSELAGQLAAAGAEAQQLREQSSHLRKLLNTRANELTELRAQATQLCNELESLRHQHDKLTQELAIQDSLGAAGGEETARLRQECEETARRLAASELRAASADSSPEQQGKLYEMQRRFEMAVEDLRDFKRRNAELVVRLAKAQAGGAAGLAVTSGGGLDWESQKRRLLESLADDDEEEADADPERRQERLTIESTISITDEVIADKDREIAELKQLLHDQSSSLGSVAVGASAIASMLDQDELIRREREKLERLQLESQEKLRQAEIDISLERATIARYRAEIEEKLACHKANVADHKAATEAASDTSKSGKPIRGRWLARLGLKDLDE